MKDVRSRFRQQEEENIVGLCTSLEIRRRRRRAASAKGSKKLMRGFLHGGHDARDARSAFKVVRNRRRLERKTDSCSTTLFHGFSQSFGGFFKAMFQGGTVEIHILVVVVFGYFRGFECAIDKGVLHGFDIKEAIRK